MLGKCALCNAAAKQQYVAALFMGRHPEGVQARLSVARHVVTARSIIGSRYSACNLGLRMLSPGHYTKEFINRMRQQQQLFDVASFHI